MWPELPPAGSRAPPSRGNLSPEFPVDRSEPGEGDPHDRGHAVGSGRGGSRSPYRARHRCKETPSRNPPPGHSPDAVPAGTTLRSRARRKLPPSHAPRQNPRTIVLTTTESESHGKTGTPTRRHRKQSTKPPKGAAQTDRKARQRNAARRSMSSIPRKNPESTPYRGPPARSPTVGPAHSPAAPQGLPHPRAHHTPKPQRHPGRPPPRTIATFPRPKGRDLPQA